MNVEETLGKTCGLYKREKVENGHNLKPITRNQLRCIHNTKCAPYFYVNHTNKH